MVVLIYKDGAAVVVTRGVATEEDCFVGEAGRKGEVGDEVELGLVEELVGLGVEMLVEAVVVENEVALGRGHEAETDALLVAGVVGQTLPLQPHETHQRIINIALDPTTYSKGCQAKCHLSNLFPQQPTIPITALTSPYSSSPSTSWPPAPSPT